MVLAKEYRIPLPVTVDEYKIAQVYMISKVSKEHTSNGEGVEVVENRAYEGEFEDGAGIGLEKGQYTHKIFHIASRLPSWLRSLAPASLQVIEKAWNAYPYCKTVYTCPLLGDRFKISIITRYLPDSGNTENALQLTEAELKDRGVDIIDIANDSIDPSKYKVEEDPTIFVSSKTGRGKLQKEWVQTTKPIMTSYKYCVVEFRYWGIQSRVENFIHKVGLRDVLFHGHRQAFCWIDEWFGLTMDEVRDIENQAQDELKSLLASSEENKCTD